MIQSTLAPTTTALFGPELELFTVDSKHTPINIHEHLKQEPEYGTDIKSELPAEQIEICSEPTPDIAELEERLQGTINTVLHLAEQAGAALLPAALHQRPTTIYPKTRYRFILETLGPSAEENAPIVASDQINVGTEEDQLIPTFNSLRNALPYLTGFAVASPVRDGEITGIQSERLRSYSLTLAAYPDITGMPPRLNAIEEYHALIEELPIFQHPNMYYTYVRPMPHRGVAAEIRSLDKQPCLTDFLAFVALTKGIAQVELPENRFLIRDFYRGANEGIFDPDVFRQFLETAEEHLPREERHFLGPIKDRLQHGTIAQRIVQDMVRGFTEFDVNEKLIACFRENRCYK